MNIFRTISHGTAAVFSAVLLATGLFSCGEDRTYEYEENTADCHTLQDVMAEWYLWNDSIRDVSWSDYFASPTSFISKLTALSPGDKWSYCLIDTVESDGNPCGYFNHVDSYGMDFVVMTDPTGETTRQYARVITVYPNSPAERCGLERNDFIARIDNNNMTTSIASQLVNGRSRTIVVNRLAVNREEATYYWSSIDTVTLEKSEKVSVDAVLINRIVSPGVGYIMLSNMDETDMIVASLKTLMEKSPGTIVFDLRLCNQGTIECAHEIAKLISNVDGTFLQTKWNSSKSSNNTSYDVSASADYRLFFITNGKTQGAPEWLIYGLRSLGQSDMTVIGTKTAGQNVMLKSIPTNYKFTVYPAVAYVAGHDGAYDYDEGLVPDSVLDELGYVSLYPYGNEYEIILNTILTDY